MSNIGESKRKIPTKGTKLIEAGSSPTEVILKATRELRIWKDKGRTMLASLMGTFWWQTRKECSTSTKGLRRNRDKAKNFNLLKYNKFISSEISPKKEVHQQTSSRFQWHHKMSRSLRFKLKREKRKRDQLSLKDKVTIQSISVKTVNTVHLQDSANNLWSMWRNG